MGLLKRRKDQLVVYSQENSLCERHREKMALTYTLLTLTNPSHLLTLPISLNPPQLE